MGRSVGARLGLRVGASVGASVGAGVGAGVGEKQSQGLVSPTHAPSVASAASAVHSVLAGPVRQHRTSRGTAGPSPQASAQNSVR